MKRTSSRVLSMGSTGPLRVSQTDQLTEKEIVDRISSAVMDHRLPAGTKLAENVLCETFDTSRARIRRVFLVLAERGIVELQSNRGAFVARGSNASVHARLQPDALAPSAHDLVF